MFLEIFFLFIKYIYLNKSEIIYRIKRGYIDEVFFFGYIDCNFVDKCILFLIKIKLVKKCWKKLNLEKRKEYLSIF